MIDLDKLLKVPEALTKYTAGSTNAEPADIPVVLQNGSINIRELKTGNINAVDTKGKISLRNNNFQSKESGSQGVATQGKTPILLRQKRYMECP